MVSKRKLHVKDRLQVMLHQDQKIKELEAQLLHLRNEFQTEALSLLLSVEQEAPDLLNSVITLSDKEAVFLNLNWREKSPLTFLALNKLEVGNDQY